MDDFIRRSFPEFTYSYVRIYCSQVLGYHFRHNSKEIILQNLHNGEVMLLHPTSSTNAAILSDVIHTLKEQGYRFGTLNELTGGSGTQ